VQIARLPNGERRVTYISEVLGIDQDGGQIITEDVFVLRPAGVGVAAEDAPETAAGTALAELTLRHTGYIPEFAEELIDKGYLDLEVMK